MNRVNRVIIAFLLGVGLFGFSYSVALAGYNDGNNTNYVDNGELNINDDYWTIYDPSEISGIDTDGGDTFYRLYREGGEVSQPYIEQSFFLPAGTVTFEHAIRSSKQLAVTFWLTNSIGTEICSGLTLGPGWRELNECSHENSTAGFYTLRYQYTRFEAIQPQTFDLDYVRIKVDGQGPTNPVISGTIPISSTCLVDTSGNYYPNTITNTTSLSGTEYMTVPANILNNYDFSAGGNVPDNWTISPALYGPSLYNGSGLYHNNLPEMTVEQLLDLPNSPDGFLFGVYASHGSLRPFDVEFGQNGRLTVEPSEVTTGFVKYEDVHITSGLQPFTIVFPDSTGLDQTLIGVDDAFVIPVQNTGSGIAVYCGAFNDPPNPIDGGGVSPVGGNPVPVYGAGEICYECRFPAGASVQITIGWLACVLRNMFSCSLRIWLYAIENAIMSMIPAVSGWALWGALTAQGYANFLGTMYNNFAVYLNSQATFIVANDEFTWLEFLYELIYLPVAILGSITDLIYSLSSLLDSATLAITVVVSLLVLLFTAITTPLLGIVQLVFTLISGLFQAFAAPAITLEDFVVSTGGTMADIESADSGLMYIAFLWGIMYVDDFISHPAVNWIVYMGGALVAIWTIMWVIQKWETVVPQSA